MEVKRGYRVEFTVQNKTLLQAAGDVVEAMKGEAFSQWKNEVIIRVSSVGNDEQFRSDTVWPEIKVLVDERAITFSCALGNPNGNVLNIMLNLPFHTTQWVPVKKTADEPCFVLTARDPQAPRLIREWAMQRMTSVSGIPYNERQAIKCVKALEIADQMMAWKNSNPDSGIAQRVEDTEAYSIWLLKMALANCVQAGIVPMVYLKVNPLDRKEDELTLNLSRARGANGYFDTSPIPDWRIMRGNQVGGDTDKSYFVRTNYAGQTETLEIGQEGFMQVRVEVPRPVLNLKKEQDNQN